MNHYDFYSLDDFIEFSPLSPNHGNLNSFCTQQSNILFQKEGIVMYTIEEILKSTESI
jgi:hypothetical protein